MRRAFPVLLCLLLLAAAIAVALRTGMGANDGPPSLWLPPETACYFHCPDLQRLDRQYAKTRLGTFLRSPEWQRFLGPNLTVENISADRHSLRHWYGTATRMIPLECFFAVVPNENRQPCGVAGIRFGTNPAKIREFLREASDAIAKGKPGWHRLREYTAEGSVEIVEADSFTLAGLVTDNWLIVGTSRAAIRGLTRCRRETIRGIRQTGFALPIAFGSVPQKRDIVGCLDLSAMGFRFASATAGVLKPTNDNRRHLVYSGIVQEGKCRELIDLPFAPEIRPLPADRGTATAFCDDTVLAITTGAPSQQSNALDGPVMESPFQHWIASSLGVRTADIPHGALASLTSSEAAIAVDWLPGRRLPAPYAVLSVEDARDARETVARLLGKSKQWKEVAAKPKHWAMKIPPNAVFPTEPVLTVEERFLIAAVNATHLKVLRERLSTGAKDHTERTKAEEPVSGNAPLVATARLHLDRLFERAYPLLRAGAAAAHALEGGKTLGSLDFSHAPSPELMGPVLGESRFAWTLNGETSSVTIHGDTPFLQLFLVTAVASGQIPLPSANDLAAPFWEHWRFEISESAERP